MPDDISNQQEYKLVKRAIHDPTAFQALYELYFMRVYGYVAARVANHLDAEDLVSDVFLRVVKGLPQFKNQHQLSFGSWVFTIARNLVTDFYRSQNQTTDTIPSDTALHHTLNPATIDNLMIEQERAAELHALLNRLSERRREVILLKYFSGLRNIEIAQILDLDERTVASHLSRGLKDLHTFYIDKSNKNDYEQTK